MSIDRTIRARTRKSIAHRLYFAYGSNLNLAQMQRRCPGSAAVQRLTIKGWRLAFRGVADIEPAEGEVVHGALYRVTPTCEATLDRYEGAAPGGMGVYRQVDFNVVLPDGHVDAFFYKMNDDMVDLPSQRYFETIATGYKEWGLPVKALRAAYTQAEATLACGGGVPAPEEGYGAEWH